MRLPALALLSVVLLAGCIPIPIPPHHAPSSRGNVPDQVPAWLQPGKTTIADVFCRLGEPDEYSPDDHTLGWLDVSRLGGGLVIFADVAALGVMVERYRRLDVRFDAAGVVVKAWMETKSCSLRKLGAGNESSEWGGHCLPPLGDTDAPAETR